jgi:uncharacterized membrane protein YczE
MQIKKAMNAWANKWFFVTEKKPRVIIVLVSLAIGLAVGISVNLHGRSDDNFWVHQAAKFIGLIATVAIGVIVLLVTSGIYNVCKWLADKNQ